MHNDPPEGHYSSDELWMYLNRLGEPTDAALVEKHLAACDICTFRARREYALSGVSGRWTPDAFARAVRRDSLLVGLASAIPLVAESARADLSQWIRDQAAAMSAAVRIISEAAGASNAILVETMVGTPAPAAFAGGRFLGTTKPTAILAPPDLPHAEIYAAPGSVSVVFKTVMQDEIPPSVFLVPADAPTMSRKFHFEWSSKRFVWAGRLSDLPSEYFIAMTPASPYAE